LKQTDHYVVIGDPIAHSLSPVMHRAAFAAAGIDADYEKERVSPSSLSRWVRKVRERPLAGFNVTIPHKELIGSQLDALDGSARSVGAVNTVVNRSGMLTGYNTDLSGFAATVQSCGITLRGRPVAVIGAGGSARAVVRALVDMEALVTICNRDEGKAQALAARLSVPAKMAALYSSAARRAIETGDLVVNTTPLGMSHLPVSPLPNGTQLDPRTVVIDLVYGSTTPLVRQALEAGCSVLDGIEMLVQQGAAAFELWTGVAPHLEVMRAACRHTLREVDICSVS
jgi:shikimate dehydrogenase